ncbi:Serine/arginine repetitive matrix protein 1, partial [Operophtera brumata]
MDDSSDEENIILKDMGFSNKIIGQIEKKSRLKNIFSSLSSSTSSKNPPVHNCVRKHNSDREVIEEWGTSTEQDTRFSDKEKKLMKQMKFGDCLTQQVDMSKVKLDVLKPWITQKITEILKMEDDVVIDYVNNQLEEKFPCPKKMQINLTGFLNGKNARLFMGELWELLLSAQASENGIPESFTQQKKEEIKKRL